MPFGVAHPQREGARERASFERYHNAHQQVYGCPLAEVASESPERQRTRDRLRLILPQRRVLVNGM